ncbi:preprotein translocase subunit YajC [Streptococcus fryi]
MNWTFILFLIPMFLMMFMTQRQQKQKAQELQNKINNLQKGDEIITIGGLYALVDEVDLANKKIVLDVDGVYLTYELYAVKTVVSKSAASSVTVEE